MLGSGAIDKLRADVDRRLRTAFLHTKAWSFAYHGTLGSASILTVVITALSANHGAYSYLVFPLSLAAAILTSLAAFGGFERKWRVNRRTRMALEDLSIVLADPSADEPAARALLRHIIRVHNEGILGPEGPIVATNTH